MSSVDPSQFRRLSAVLSCCSLEYASSASSNVPVQSPAVTPFSDDAAVFTPDSLPSRLMLHGQGDVIRKGRAATGDESKILCAFTADQVVALTGLSDRQLAYWDRTGFFPPQYGAAERRSPYSRVYSFTDVVGLRTLSTLKGGYNISLPHLRAVAAKLSAYSKTPWADLRLKVWNRKVQFDEPETGRTVGVVDGQYILLPIRDVIEDKRRKAEGLRQRDPSKIGQVEKHRYVARNALVIAGTRVPVSAIQHYLNAGFSAAEIIAEYPTITEQDIDAVRQQGSPHLAA